MNIYTYIHTYKNKLHEKYLYYNKYKYICPHVCINIHKIHLFLNYSLSLYLIQMQKTMCIYFYIHSFHTFLSQSRNGYNPSFTHTHTLISLSLSLSNTHAHKHTQTQMHASTHTHTHTHTPSKRKREKGNVCLTMDKLKLTGWTLGWVFNSRSGCMSCHALTARYSNMI
jgi:hypothetical protein